MRTPRLAPRFVVAAASVAALTVAATPGGAADKAPRWNAPVLVSATESARETSLVIDPTDNRRQFACAPSGVPAIGTGQSYFHASRDGGRTWKSVDVETSQTDTRQAAFEGGDCDVAYDAGGTMYSADTWLGDLSIGHSKDRGESWTGSAITASSPVVDRPWLVGGPKGTLYVTYQDVQCCTPSAMWFMKSTDYGQTFTPAVPITTANADGLYTWEGNFVVSPSGRDLYLVFSRRSSAPVSTGAPSPETIWVTHSADGGQTWKETLVSANPEETTTIYPSLGLDAGGNLHVVWSAPAKVGNPISYTASRDGGRTWSKPIALNPGKVGLAPWIVGGKAGEAAVAWLGSHDPKATASRVADYHFFWARVTLPKAGAPTVRTGATTKEPIFSGKQVVPEFETVRLDRNGKMHLGMSVFKAPGRWAVMTQSER